MKVDIIDIGIGNINSIENWLTNSNFFCTKVKKPNDIRSDLIVLPGVGSAKLYLEKLKFNKFDLALKNHIKRGGRIIGICLGFQILFDYLEEDGGVQGLGFFSGKVIQLKSKKSHTGWEKLVLKKDKLFPKWKSKMYSVSKKQIINGRVFYNHNYGVVTEDKNLKTEMISKKLNYISLILSNQIIGFQFHPEKSQITGKNLIELVF
tara:strand:+ start:16287 stop:16904 length:618 start_codon:yes stop_codon:yes gene_type:complete